LMETAENNLVCLGRILKDTKVQSEAQHTVF